MYTCFYGLLLFRFLFNNFLFILNLIYQVEVFAFILFIIISIFTYATTHLWANCTYHTTLPLLHFIPYIFLSILINYYVHALGFFSLSIYKIYISHAWFYLICLWLGRCHFWRYWFLQGLLLWLWSLQLQFKFLYLFLQRFIEGNMCYSSWTSLLLHHLLGVIWFFNLSLHGTLQFLGSLNQKLVIRCFGLKIIR